MGPSGSGESQRRHPAESRGGIDYAALRARVSIRDILARIHYEPLTIRGDQWRGLCPLPNHPELDKQKRSFSVHVRRNIYYCFRCHSGGNQLDLWAALRQMSLYDAAHALCREFQVDAIKHRIRNPRTPPYGTSPPATPGSL